MQIDTTRFGRIEVNEDLTITFPKGILGFPGCQSYALIQPSDDTYFYWLQSVEVPDLAFIVTNPAVFVPGYKVPLKAEQMQELGITKEEEAEVFVIVNKHGETLTGNLQGPLVIDLKTRKGAQLVLSDKRFTTRVPLLELKLPSESLAAAASAA